MTARLVLDCDPGHDDLLAIVLASHYADVIGITTVAGNAPLERTTHNANVARELLGLDAPLHSGAERPLLAEPHTSPAVHGGSGLDGANLPAPSRPVESPDAARFLIDAARATDDLWLVATGPLTNIATALRSAPDLPHRIAGISLMGGGSFGNRTAAAEFNIWCDPEAAAIVFDSGVPIVMAGLDVTHQFQATPDRIAMLDELGTALGSTIGALLRFFSSTYIDRSDDGALAGAPMHDALAVLALTHTNLFTSVQRRVAVETSGAITRGMTVIDERRLVERPASNCTVLTSVDSDAAFAVLAAAIAAFG